MLYEVITARQSEFTEEISNFVIAFSNIFLALILMAVVIGIFISRQLTRPLVIIQEKIKAMDIKKKAEKIIYTRNDELGGLIREYNRKVDELSESANKLAQSEREMAWREMAKQIAHRITSYNVCYTKLLRFHAMPFHAPIAQVYLQTR